MENMIMDQNQKIQEVLKEQRYDGFLEIGVSNKNANMYYLTEVKMPDPATFLQTTECSVLMTPALEVERARKEASVDKVIGTGKYQEGDLRGDKEARFQALVDFLRDNEIGKIGVSPYFELETAEKLRAKGFEIDTVDDIIEESRICKESREIELMRKAQRTTEKAMKKAEQMLKDSEVRGKTLYLEDKVLTTERIKIQVKIFLLKHNYENPEGMIVTSGAESGDPHKRDSGAIKEGEPVIIDIFPRSPERYFGDMTRTFVKGEASSELKEIYQTVKEAKQIAMKELERGEGISAEELNSKVFDYFEQKGFQTQRQGDIKSGALHSIGHALGLEPHEPPRIGKGGGKLKSGMILTIEPGLYDPEIGGVRIEDMILITEDGYENFNLMHKQLEV